jgi:hypothetical protein
MIVHQEGCETKFCEGCVFKKQHKEPFLKKGGMKAMEVLY